MSKVINFLHFYQRQDKLVFFSYLFSLLMILIMIILFLIKKSSLPSHIPLFYSQPWGDSQLGSLSQFLLLPLLSTLFVLINLAFTLHLHPAQKFLRRTLSLSTLFICFLMLITVWEIIFIFI